MDTVTLMLCGADWEPSCVQRFKESVENIYNKIVTGCWRKERRKEGEKEGRKREGRQRICLYCIACAYGASKH